MPGVGKSTFIEALGSRLTAEGHRVGVLAVDPSSIRTGGSVLGDKTRMAKLSADPHAYIRPSPSAGTLGGVARATVQAMAVLEAAGYDVVLVETVGVGQSEVTVAGMVDTFLFLTLARTGDQLQGIKKGILEIADLIAVNKADGDREQEARSAARDLAGALRLVRRRASGRRPWSPARRSTTSASTTCGGGCSSTATTSAPRAWAASAPSSSWTSPGRWSATSWTSGSATRPASAPSASRCAPRCSPASSRRRWRRTASWRRTTTGTRPPHVLILSGHSPLAAGTSWSIMLAGNSEVSDRSKGCHAQQAHHLPRHSRPRRRGSRRRHDGQANADSAAKPSTQTLAKDLLSPLSLAVSRDGTTYFSQNFAGLLMRQKPGPEEAFGDLRQQGRLRGRRRLGAPRAASASRSARTSAAA